LQNTLTRRKEAYHHKLFEEPKAVEEISEHDGIDTIHNSALEVDDTLRDALIYDWYLKNSFIDHISDDHFGVDNFRHCDFREYGDFVNQPFDMTYNQKKVTFSREGGLYFPHKVSARLKKTFSPKPNGLDFEIVFSSEAEGNFNYVLEHNFHFADYDTLLINGLKLDAQRESAQMSKLEIIDTHLKKKITIELKQPFALFFYRHETLSQSENGFDLTLQNISFAMVIGFTKELSIQGSLEVEDV